MLIAVTGSSGLIGEALVTSLRGDGHEVRRVVRRRPSAPDEVQADAAGLAGVDAVVHLAGEPIASKRWTAEQKRRIRDSRVEGTKALVDVLSELDPRPRVLLSGSAVGFYGDGGEAELDESSPPGSGFLAEVVTEWEAAAAPAADAGIRTVLLRTGIVLSPEGGALGPQLPLFKLGLGGPIGSGRPWWPWITIDDEVGAIRHLLTTEVEGPVNLCAPNPARQRDVAKALGAALHRPAVLPVPKFGPRLLLGKELADSLLGDSLRVVPRRLLESGYVFRHPDLGPALAALFDR